MTRYIAFLRAINVGGHLVKMTELKAIFEGLGLNDVATFIASGNVIFSSRTTEAARLEKLVSVGLEKALGYPVVAFIRTTSAVAEVAEFQPFPKPAMARGTLYIGFLPSPPAPEAVKAVARLATPADALRVAGRELYWLRETSLLDSPISMAKLEKTLALPTTFRNANTVRRLAAKYPVTSRGGHNA